MEPGSVVFRMDSTWKLWCRAVLMYTGKKKDIADAVTLSRTFLCGDRGRGGRCCVFGGVSYYCDIYVNGRLAGSHEGMWDNFSTDVSGLVKNGENELTITVWKPGYYKEDRFPLREVLSGFIPVLCTFRGIWDDVYLLLADTFFIGQNCAAAVPDGSGKLTVDINCADNALVKITGTVYGPTAKKPLQSAHNGKRVRVKTVWKSRLSCPSRNAGARTARRCTAMNWRLQQEDRPSALRMRSDAAAYRRTAAGSFKTASLFTPEASCTGGITAD